MPNTNKLSTLFSAEKELEVINERRYIERKVYVDYRTQKLTAGFKYKAIYGRNDFHVRKKETEEYGGPPKVPLVIKADVDGSLEAILQCFDTYDDGTRDLEVKLDLMDFGVGEVTEADVMLGMDCLRIAWVGLRFNAH